MKIGVLFVCFGNICRSPSARGVFQQLVDSAALGQHFTVDSCGTAALHIGKAPDPRAIQVAAQRGIDISHYRARQIDDSDFHRFHYIVAMDRKNLQTLSSWLPVGFSGQLNLLKDFCQCSDGDSQIVDPYKESIEQFEAVLDTLFAGAQELLVYLCKQHQLKLKAP